MKNLTPEVLAEVTGGFLSCREENKKKEISSITTDSRKVEKDCLFIPIKGTRADGHDFIPAVMAGGALLTLTERTDTEESFDCLYVKSTEEALRKIAGFYLKEMNLPVIAVTGSVGKTSTKEMIASVMSEKYRTLKTQGNFNNELGLPLTIFRLRVQDEAAVLEMGISHFGDMTVLASMANPDIAVITNIGTCHLENLVDRDGVFRAKTEIFDFLKKDGRVVLNGDDDKLLQVKEVCGKKPVFFGLKPTHEIWADKLETLGIYGIACRIHTPKESFEVKIPIPGHHMVYNALAATAVGLLMGISAAEIKKGIESVEALSGRFHLIETGKGKGEKKSGQGPSLTIIDDCYNANPMSMKASLGILQEALGRRVALLGDMGELGVREKELHREVGVYASEHCPELLMTAGPLAELIAREVKKNKPDAAVYSFPDTESLEEALERYIRDGDTILVKASHFMDFSRLTRKLESL